MTSRWTELLGLLLVGAVGLGCAAGDDPPGRIDGGPGGMDAGTREVDSGPMVERDAGPAPVEDAGVDAGPLETTGGTCEPCRGDSDCQIDHYCANVAVGGQACLPSCVIDLPDCPSRFDCVANFSGSIPEPVCAPVGDRCCVDEDADQHGHGVGCMGLDCDDADPDTHNSAIELCDGVDNNCNDVIDDGDVDAMCPRGEHVAQTECAEGACGILECEPGFGDCDDDPTNGCETQTNTLDNCGMCGTTCVLDHATPECAVGECRIGSCDEGYGDCDMDPRNGCETPLNTLTDCGQCGRSCSPEGAIGDCSTASCEIASCNRNRGDCDMNPVNGCETLLTTNADCGACGMICAPSGGVGDCSTGSCRLTTCTAPGVADCDGDSLNGCETSTRTVTDCGGCDVQCTRNNGTADCSTGACSLAGCDDGWGSCDDIDSNGCEQRLNTNTHCGGCNTSCEVAHGSGDCSSGSCEVASCDPGWDDCDGDPSNGCEQPLNTNTHCTACDLACTLSRSTESCSTGSCRITSCDPGWAHCDSSQANGCETSLRTNSNCGGCGVTCSEPHSTTSCSTGVCEWTGCDSGYSNCDSDTTNGCEVYHNDTIGSCGGGTDVGAYDGDRSCGAWCGGNTTWNNFAAETGIREAWFKARLREDSSCSATIEHRIRLDVPSGIDYDLYVYRGSSCSYVGRSANRGTGRNESFTISEGERSGSDQDFDYYVQVRYYSGATCSAYTVRFDGHDC